MEFIYFEGVFTSGGIYNIGLSLYIMVYIQ